MARNPELEKAILDDPSNVDAYLVYADYLQTQGDPRGELITLFHQNKIDEANAFIEKHAAELYGPLLPYRKVLDGSGASAFTWRLGFIRSARVGYCAYSSDDAKDGDEDATSDRAVAALLSHPSGMFLEELVVTINMLEDGGYFEPVVHAIAKHGAPALRRLRLGEFIHAGPGGAEDGYEYEISWTGIGDATELWKALPRLEKLELQVGLGSTSAGGNQDRFGTIELPKLKSLEIVTGGMSQDCARSLAAANWPALESMHLWFGSNNYGAGGTVDDIAPILDGERLPKLERLGLMNAEFTDDICARLPGAKVLPRLKDLSLAYGMMTDAGAKSLLESPKAFAHLGSLDVSANYLGSDTVASLERLAKEVQSGEQKDAADNYRYVSLSE